MMEVQVRVEVGIARKNYWYRIQEEIFCMYPGYNQTRHMDFQHLGVKSLWKEGCGLRDTLQPTQGLAEA